MFFNTPGNPTKMKHAVYLGASVFLGLLLSLIAHALIEMAYLSLASSQGWKVMFYNGCALHPAVQIALWLAGATLGISLGRAWWRYIYVDRTWDKK